MILVGCFSTRIRSSINVVANELDFMYTKPFKVMAPFVTVFSAVTAALATSNDALPSVAFEPRHTHFSIQQCDNLANAPTAASVISLLQGGLLFIGTRFNECRSSSSSCFVVSARISSFRWPSDATW